MSIPDAVVVQKSCIVCGGAFAVEVRYKQYQGREACSKACIGKLGQLRKQGLLPNVLEEERVCAGCGAAYTAKRRSQGIAFPEFCSPPCANKGAGDRKRDDSWIREEERLCAVCQQPFVAKRREKGRDFPSTCSLACQVKKRVSNLKRQCRQCGGIFYQQRSVVKRGANGGSFCSKECYHAHTSESGRLAVGTKRDKGYVLIYVPLHPQAKKTGKKYVYEHRLVMEQMIGRYLEPHENVHHIDGNRSNNVPENLELWSSPQPSGQRVRDVYKQDVERLARENMQLKQRIATLEAELLTFSSS